MRVVKRDIRIGRDLCNFYWNDLSKGEILDVFVAGDFSSGKKKDML